jgi:Ca2+/H+ antiporter
LTAPPGTLSEWQRFESCRVRHADRLAVRLGEAYGTLILTLSFTVIEVTRVTS